MIANLGDVNHLPSVCRWTAMIAGESGDENLEMPYSIHRAGVRYLEIGGGNGRRSSFVTREAVARPS
jgi:hypothetical protein